jgi:ABC-type amino acid transport substrate-binding protein
MICRLILLLCIGLIGPAVHGAEIRFPGGNSPDDKRWDFVLEILALALQKAPASDGPDRIIRLPAQMQARRIAELSAGELDVAVGIGSKDLMQKPVIFIPLPLQRGLLGWRLLLANREGADKLARVHSIEDLRPLRMGFVRTFADYRAMLANQLNVVDGADYQGMFRMLSAGRMDYLSRGVGEVFDEHALLLAQGIKGIDIEPQLALHYRADWFFVVNPARRDLAERITRGLEAARQDGSYERAFQRSFGPILARAKLEQRQVIELVNPDFPDLGASVPPGWWWQPETRRRTDSNAAKP